VKAVAERAAQLEEAVPADDRPALVAAAWLHDIGYSPTLAQTGFHPLDGAEYLKTSGWPSEIVELVAHHSGARFEAAERGLTDQLARYPYSDTAVLDALVTADLTTGPGGESLTYDQRITEILRRYPADDPVHRTWVKAASIVKESLQRTEERLAASHPR
jgi:putative nucleotidyltransferase with HDIG domain